MRRAHPSKKASGADAAQFPPVPVLVPMLQSAPASGPNATGDVGMDDAHHLLDQIPPRCVLDFFAVQACLPGRCPPAAVLVRKKRERIGIVDGLSEGSKRENRETGCVWATLEVVWPSFKI